MPPVVYNTNKYEVMEVNIVAPSNHLYNGNKIEGELVIIHSPVSTGPPLLVYVPIVTSGDSTTASNLLTQIITSVAQNAPAQGETTNVNVSSFNLNQFVTAKKPFFSHMFEGYQCIVFGLDSAIPLKKETIQTLSKVLNNSGKSIPGNGMAVYYNPDGATYGFSNTDQIYIDCQPVDTSEEQVKIEKDIKNPNTYDLNSPAVTLVFQIIVGCILFFIVLFAIYYGLKYISNYVGNFHIPRSTIPSSR
jgi:hypothetical protein